MPTNKLTQYGLLLFVLLGLLNNSVSAVEKLRITIPAGSFNMGCSSKDRSCDDDEGIGGGVSVFVPEFQIDNTEVTAQSYFSCIRDGYCRRPSIDFEDNKYCNLGAPRRNKHPMNCINWTDAASYCRWAKGSLPTEVQWEKAARGNTSSRFAWGNEAASCKHAILNDGRTKNARGVFDGCGKDRTAPVASRPANSYELYDMHGNVAEWTNTWYVSNAITYWYAKRRLKGPPGGDRRVVRGGGWTDRSNNLRSSFRNALAPESRSLPYATIGFRCIYE